MLIGPFVVEGAFHLYVMAFLFVGMYHMLYNSCEIIMQGGPP